MLITLLFFTTLSNVNQYEVFATNTKKTLNVTSQTQLKTNWCWNTCISMTYKYITGKNKSQESIYKIWFGKNGNEAASLLAMERTAEAIGLNASMKTSHLSFNDIVKQIDKGQPIIARRFSTNKNNKIGHGYLIIGYNKTKKTITVIDPADGKRYTGSYSSFVNDGKYK